MTRALRALAVALVALVGLAAAPGARARPPRLQARAAILVQPQTGDVVLARAADQERPIASTTKLMTALLTLEHGDLGQLVPAARYDAAPIESTIGLRAGERLSVRDLLRGLLLASGNDAAVTLADAVGGGSEARFVARMNARARALGLRHTHYANPVGLDEADNFSSARDLVTLAQRLLADPFFARTVDLPRATLRTGAHPRTIVNRNALVREVPWVDGVKTGHTTQAGYVLVGAARRDGVQLVSAVLGDPSEAARDADTLALLRYGLARYRDPVVVRAGQVLAHVRLRYRGGQTVALLAQSTLHAVLRRGERPSLRVVGVPAELDGPLAAGDPVGAVVVRAGNRLLGRVPLVTARPVAEASLAQRAGSFFSSPAVLALIAVLVACSLSLALLRKRAGGARTPRARRRGGREVA